MPRGVSRTQQKMMAEKGYLAQRQAAKLLGLHWTSFSNWEKQGRITQYRINRSCYIRKSEILVMLRDLNPQMEEEYGAWLLGIEATGECRVCAIPMPLHITTCPDCETLKLTEEK